MAEIPAYIAQLTSIILVSDTRVTNHGYENGVATPLQYVLQAGTAVLVDRYGVPRARCFCGNPLLPPAPVQGTPTYVGNAWPGFDPTRVIVVVQNPTPVDSFEIRIPATPTGELTTVPAGPCVVGSPCDAPGPGAAVPTNAPTAEATPTAAPTNAPPQTGTLKPPPGVACSAGSDAAPAWVHYWIKNNSSQAVDIYWLPWDCLPQFSVKVDPDGDPNGFGYGWMGFQGDTYYAVPAGAPSDSTPIAIYTVSPEGTWEIQ